MDDTIAEKTLSKSVPRDWLQNLDSYFLPNNPTFPERPKFVAVPQTRQVHALLLKSLRLREQCLHTAVFFIAHRYPNE